MEDMFGKSERGIEKGMELSGKPEEEFEPGRISIELSKKDVKDLNILYNMMKPELATDLKVTAKHLFLRGINAVFMEISVMMHMKGLMGGNPFGNNGNEEEKS